MIDFLIGNAPQSVAPDWITRDGFGSSRAARFGHLARLALDRPARFCREASQEDERGSLFLLRRSRLVSDCCCCWSHFWLVVSLVVYWLGCRLAGKRTASPGGAQLDIQMVEIVRNESWPEGANSMISSCGAASSGWPADTFQHSMAADEWPALVVASCAICKSSVQLGNTGCHRDRAPQVMGAQRGRTGAARRLPDNKWPVATTSPIRRGVTNHRIVCTATAIHAKSH